VERLSIYIFTYIYLLWAIDICCGPINTINIFKNTCKTAFNHTLCFNCTESILEEKEWSCQSHFVGTTVNSLQILFSFDSMSSFSVVSFFVVVQ